MKTIPLWNTGTKVSIFYLGTMNLGSRTDKKTSFELLDKYLEASGAKEDVDLA